MELILIRHGDPNYKDNSLTPLGHLQAEAAAPRISALEPTALYSSPYGRALQTAEHTASLLGMEITLLDFMREISSGLEGMEAKEKLPYSPWLSSQTLARAGEDLVRYDYSEHFAWKGTLFAQSYARVTEGFDAWFRQQGFEREGLYYRCTRKNDEKPAIFAHGGSISCLLAHFTGVPVQWVCGFLRLDCTGITIIRFAAEPGELAIPEILTVNELTHLHGLTVSDGLPQ